MPNVETFLLIFVLGLAIARNQISCALALLHLNEAASPTLEIISHL
jgi:hypothetical protein